MVKNGCGLFGLETIESAVSQERNDEMSWFFACWYKFRKAKSFFSYWVGIAKNGRDLIDHGTQKQVVSQK